MDLLKMLDELRRDHHISLFTHADGTRAVLEVRNAALWGSVVLRYIGTLSGCIARAWAGEPPDER